MSTTRQKMSYISQKEWKKSLTSILEELDPSQFLKMQQCLDKIPKGQKTNRSKEKMPQKIIEHYGVEGSISAIKDAMEDIPRRDAVIQDLLRPFVDKMRNKHPKKSKGRKRKRDLQEEEEQEEEKKEEEERPAADLKTRCQHDTERKTPPWRKTLRDLNSSRELQDTDGIIGKVAEKSGLRTYKTKEHAEKFFFYVAVADDTASVKVMVYGKQRYKEIKEGKFYFFRRLIKDEKAVKVTAKSKVSETSSAQIPEVPAELEMDAQKLIYPESPVFSIAKAKVSAVGTNMSVEGIVTEIDPVTPVKVKDKRKTTKRLNFQITDNTVTIEICVWGETTSQCEGLSAGDVIKVTNVKTRKYLDNVSLNSTGFTRIHKVESVGVQNVRVEFIGVRKATMKETHLEAVLNHQVHTVVVASRLLAQAFGFTLDRNFRESLPDKMPLAAEAVIAGSRIKKLTAA